LASTSRAWINWGDIPTSVILTWQVEDEQLSKNQYVKYGYTSGILTEETDYATISTYATPPTSKLASYKSSYIERAILTNLPIGSTNRVYYSFGSNSAGWSNESSFTAHPGIGPNTTISMVILGDTGFIEKDSHGKEVFEAISRPDFQSKINAGGIILGDLTYANGNQTIWDVFQDVFEPVSSTMSFMANAGNHGESKSARFLVQCVFLLIFIHLPHLFFYLKSSSSLFFIPTLLFILQHL
jgi:hypothetical protein